MMENSKRNHISFIFEDIFTLIKSLYFFMIIAFINIKSGGGYVLVGIVIFSLIKSFFKYLNTKYLVEDNELKYFSGIINKKKMEIPFNKIHTIDINENLIDRLLNICTLKIDTGAVKEVGQEIKLKLLKEEAYEIRKLINELKEDKNTKYKTNKVNLIKQISFKEIFLYSLSKSKVFWAFGGLFVVNDIILKVEEYLNITITNNIIESVDMEKIYTLGITKIISYGILVFIILYIIVSIIFIVFELIRLFNFSLISDENDIKIKYGLITKKEYSIPRDKISAVRFNQNLIQQLFKIYQIEVVVVGYGDENKEQAILYPIAKIDFINTTMRDILPSFSFDGNINKPPKKALGRFIIKRTIILLLFFIVPSYFILPESLLLMKLVLFSFLIIFNIILGYINYKNTSLGVNRNILRTSSGSLFKNTTLIKQEFLQSVEIKESPFQRRKNICDFKLDIYSNKMGDIVLLRNLEKILINTIDKNLIL